MQLKHLPFILSLLVCLAVTAQVLSPISRRAIILSGLATSSSPPYDYWWVSSDMSNAISVTNWIDRIQGSHWTNGTTGATRPTNSTTGVHFDGANSQQLTNTGINFGSTSTHFVVIKREGAGAFQDILDKANDGSLEWGYLFVAGVQAWRVLIVSASKLVDGAQGTTMFDMTITSDGVANQSVGYTNGVPYVTNATTSFTGPWRLLGGSANGGFFTGWIAEMKSSTSVVWTATQVMTEHTRSASDHGY